MNRTTWKEWAMPLPVLEVMSTSTRLFEAKNEAGKQLLGLVDAAQKIFPEDSNWISRNWERDYRVDGSGFKHVIRHLEAATCNKRTAGQQAHLTEMQAFAKEIWH